MTSIFIEGDGTPVTNIAFMESNADEILPDYTYQRILTEEEMVNERETFTELSIQLAQIEEQKAQMMAEINARKKAKKTALTKSLILLRVGRMEVTENVYLIKDENELKVGTFNWKGEIISERPMKQTERQRNLFKEPITYKTGTDE
jgi:hypothetical protein